MSALVILAILAFVVWVVRKSSKNVLLSAGAIDRLEQSGVRGRGLVLSAFQISTGVTLSGCRFERKQLTLDVELPGRAPYVVSGQFLVPRGQVEATPGASLDLAVDPADPGRVVVLGPGGFTGPWLRLGPPNAY